MKPKYKMESVLISLAVILCAILFLKLIYSLRFTLPWRVNCWFCNNNFWVKFVERNCWICLKCEQYNGFTKDGDYNRPLICPDQSIRASGTPKLFQNSPPKNGLCKMCNVNQQIKVMQLANFVPMNERNFDYEIEVYRTQLEKAYKLCTPCKKVVQMKLHKEKETLLGFKLLESRTPEKKIQRQGLQTEKLRNFVNKLSMVIAGLLLVLVTYECCRNSIKYKSISAHYSNIKEIFKTLLERVLNIIKMKTMTTFPSLENYGNNLPTVLYIDMLPKDISFKYLSDSNLTTQKALGGFICLVQIIGHIWNVNKISVSILIDLLWSTFVIMSTVQDYIVVEPIYLSLVKLTSVMMLLVVYKSMRSRTRVFRQPTRLPRSPKKLWSPARAEAAEDTFMDTDDDVSLSKFGLQTPSDSSDTSGPFSHSMLSGRAFMSRAPDLWTKPKPNSTFSVNSTLVRSPTFTEASFAKPSFGQYRKMQRDDSDSDLDESISSLCIGSPSKGPRGAGSVFSLRQFTATPLFAAPAPLGAGGSRGGAGASSWVAGGYWGAGGAGAAAAASRSSSQSSGFESQTSSLTRNVFSSPPSREDSICGETERFQPLGGPVPRTTFDMRSRLGSPISVGSLGLGSPLCPPVFPPLPLSAHVQLPAPRWAGSSGLIRLPTLDPRVAH